LSTFDLGFIGTFQISGTFNMIVGWNVYLTQGSDVLNGTYFNAVYAPFVNGWATGKLVGQNYLANGNYYGTMYYARSYLNITLQVFGDGDVCFQGTASFLPVQLVTGLSSALSSC
jgi:hypothetical protein